MTIPFINILAPSMGGIGPIELADLGRLNALNNGVPFYAGRFYPKNHTKFWDGIKPGLISQTPPWVTWEDIEDTQIWMVSAFKGEKIVSTNTSIDRIDLWPREPEDDLPVWENTIYDQQAQARGWGDVGLDHIWTQSGSCDPGIEITQNVMGVNLATLGALGISKLSGYCSEYAFYDQELRFANGAFYGQPNQLVEAGRHVRWDRDGNPTPPLEEYKELLRIREDGPWMYRNADLPPQGQLNFPTRADGFPDLPYLHNDGSGWVSSEENYKNWVITDREKAKTYGNDWWDYYTKYIVDGSDVAPRMGQMLQIKPSELETVVYTIKTACQVVYIPEENWWGADIDSEVEQLGAYALTTYGAYLTNQIWYFYLPVRYNGKFTAERTDFLLNRAGIKRNSDPNYIAP